MRIVSRARNVLGNAYRRVARVGRRLWENPHTRSTKKDIPLVNPHTSLAEHSAELFRSIDIKDPHPDKEIDFIKGVKVVDKEDGTHLKISYKDGTVAAVKAPPDLHIFVNQGLQFINRSDMPKGDEREVSKVENLALRGRIIMDKNDTVIGSQSRFGEPNNISSEYTRDPYFYYGSQNMAKSVRIARGPGVSEDTQMEKELERYQARYYQAQNIARYDRSEIAAGRVWYKMPTFVLALADVLFLPVDLAYFAGSRLFRAVASIYRSVTGFWKNPALELSMLKGYLRAAIRQFFNRNGQNKP